MDTQILFEPRKLESVTSYFDPWEYREYFHVDACGDFPRYEVARATSAEGLGENFARYIRDEYWKFYGGKEPLLTRGSREVEEFVQVLQFLTPGYDRRVACENFLDFSLSEEEFLLFKGALSVHSGGSIDVV